MPNNSGAQPLLVERIERALILLAYFIELDGDVHLPMYAKFEAELAELKQREGTKDRAKRLLNAYKRSGGPRALPLPATSSRISASCLDASLLP